MRAVDWLLDKSLLKLFPSAITPNLITTGRFLLVPIVFGLLFVGRYDWGLILFTLAAFSDVLDGALARTRGAVSDWGKLFDPLADKLLIGSAALVLITRLVNWWLAGALVVIELLLIFTAYFKLQKRGVTAQANWSGKIKMFCQSIGLITLLLYLLTPFAWLLLLAKIILYFALGFGIISLVVYRSI